LLRRTASFANLILALFLHKICDQTVSFLPRFVSPFAQINAVFITIAAISVAISIAYAARIINFGITG
jgi:hypothetical protein